MGLSANCREVVNVKFDNYRLLTSLHYHNGGHNKGLISIFLFGITLLVISPLNTMGWSWKNKVKTIIDWSIIAVWSMINDIVVFDQSMKNKITDICDPSFNKPIRSIQINSFWSSFRSEINKLYASLALGDIGFTVSIFDMQNISIYLRNVIMSTMESRQINYSSVSCYSWQQFKKQKSV